MNIRRLNPLVIFSLLIFLSGCNEPTYSKEKVKEAIIRLCKDEYNLDVGVQIIGSTLGVFIPIEGLIDINLTLDKSATEKIEDVALSIHRISMSTDRPLKLYTLTARDTNTSSAEFILTGASYDVVRVRLLDISRGEYHKRLLRDFRFNPEAAGLEKVKDLFRSLDQPSPLTETIKPIFYPIYVIGAPDSQRIELVEISSKEISAQEALFYIKTKEYYEHLPGSEIFTAIFPQGFNNEYLILTDISIFPNAIKDIIPKYFYSDNEIKKRDLKQTFALYKDTGHIGIDGFPKRELEMGWFLNEQLARRIKILFEEDKALKEKFFVQSSQGLIENNVLHFKFAISSNEPSDKDSKTIFSKILKTIGTVLHRYEFQDFEGVQLVNTQPHEKKIYLSKEELELFRMDKIKFEDIITNSEHQITKPISSSL